MSGVASRCLHCEAEIRPGTAVVDRSDGAERTFCCRGCQGAYELITGAGLADFYSRRQWREKGVAGGAYHDEYTDDYLARYVSHDGDVSSLDILIDGIRCASCVWLNEKIIAALPGVRDVRVNYATGRARVLFDAAIVTPVDIFHRVSAAGYVPRPYSPSAVDAAWAAERRDLLVRFGTAAFLTMQLMASSFALYAGYFQGMGETMKQIMQWFSLVVATPVVFYSGWPFLRGAWRSLVNRAPNMDLLVAIGALSSWLYSSYALIDGGEVYFETAAMIVTLILVGRLLEHAARRRASAGVERLLACAPDRAFRCRGDDVDTVASGDLVPGDLILVREGERFPVDGVMAAGETEVDESPATGESLPVAKRVGDPVIAGSINLLGSVRVRILRSAADSFIARIARLVEEAQQRRAPIQNLAERVSAFFVPLVLLLGAATFGVLLLSGAPFDGALMRGLAVVVIACPCALGLATPTAIVAGTGAAAAAGVIFRGGDVLERLSRVRRVVFDKTGTLTEGRPEVVAVRPGAGVTQDELVAVCAGVESGSGHPLARGVMSWADQRGLGYFRATGLRAVPGGGVVGTLEAAVAVAGTGRFLREQGITGFDEQEPDSGSIVHVARDGRYLGRILLKDRLRQAAPALVGYFDDLGVHSTLLSGDRAGEVREIAAAAGIGEVRWEMLPGDKVAYVTAREGEGEVLLMVGDGINDAPALSAASVGCAMAGGTDIALETSELLLTKPDLERIATAHHLARRTMRVIRQNLAWAFAYNLLGIPLAMTGRLTPVHAAAAMALSSLCVVGNSLRLTRPVQGSGTRA